VNGPFGDLRGKYWGVDWSPTVQASNLPIGTEPNQITVYSNPNAANRKETPVGVSMFKHNSKNLFWMGDGSFLSAPPGSAAGWGTNDGAEPFATINTAISKFSMPTIANNYTNYPVPRPYGVNYKTPDRREYRNIIRHGSSKCPFVCQYANLGTDAG